MEGLVRAKDGEAVPVQGLMEPSSYDGRARTSSTCSSSSDHVHSVTFQTRLESYVKPALQIQKGPVELTGMDAALHRMNLRFVYVFHRQLDQYALKDSLSQVLSGFPLLCGRERVSSRRRWVDCDGTGALVRQQVAVVGCTADEMNDATMQAHIEHFCGGKPVASMKERREAPLAVTLTDITYERKTAVSWAPSLFAACAGHTAMTDDKGSADDERKSEECTPPEPPLLDYNQSATEESQIAPKYAVGFCINHDVADGASVAHFLTAWSMASVGRPFPASSADRGILATLPSGIPRQPSHYVQLGWMQRALLATRMKVAATSHEFVTMTFCAGELKAMKAAAMAPLHGTESWVSTSNVIAAHLWPMLSQAIMGTTGMLAIMRVLINLRPALDLHNHYFGNAVTARVIQPPHDGDVTDEDDAALSRRALHLREGAAMSDDTIEDVKHELEWLNHTLHHGDISSVRWTSMVEAFAGKPYIVWNDMSELPPSKDALHGLCGIPAMSFKFCRLVFPGMAIVLPLSPQDPASKCVTVCVSRAAAAVLRSPDVQERVHNFAPLMVERAEGCQQLHEQ